MCFVVKSRIRACDWHSEEAFLLAGRVDYRAKTRNGACLRLPTNMKRRSTMNHQLIGSNAIRSDSGRQQERTKFVSRLLRSTVLAWTATLALLSHSPAVHADAEVLHTYGSSLGQ